jgi:hypothetical protein
MLPSLAVEMDTHRFFHNHIFLLSISLSGLFFLDAIDPGDG